MASCSNSYALSRFSATLTRVNRKGGVLFPTFSNCRAGDSLSGWRCPSEDAAVQPGNEVNSFNQQLLQAGIIGHINIHLGHCGGRQVDRIGRRDFVLRADSGIPVSRLRTEGQKAQPATREVLV